MTEHITSPPPKHEYIIPLLDVSNHVDPDDCSSSEDDCSCPEEGSQSSASISIASNEESAESDDEEEEEGSSSDNDDDEDDTEESDDEEEDWNYKYFPEDETRIRFSAEVEVHDTLRRDDYTPQEKMAAFLTPKDKKAQWFYQNKAIARLEWWLDESPEFRIQHRMSKEERDERGDPKFVARGLHQMTDKGYDRMNSFKNACVDAVLREQEAQWTAAGRPDNGRVMWDFDRIAAASLSISRGGIVESYKIAKRDEQQAQKAYREMERQEWQATEQQKRARSSPTNVAGNMKKKYYRAPSPLTTTPTTVTTTLTSNGSASNLEYNLDVKKQHQALDILDVVSVDSTLTGDDRSLLTLEDGSILTPPKILVPQGEYYRQRLSLQREQMEHEAMKAAMHMDLGGGTKRRASAPPSIRHHHQHHHYSRGE